MIGEVPISSFHPAVQHWFTDRLITPVRLNAKGGRSIRKGRHILIAAPTGSGKTLATFPQDIGARTMMIPTQVEAGLAARGLATCDSFAGLRGMLVPPSRRRSSSSPANSHTARASFSARPSNASAFRCRGGGSCVNSGRWKHEVTYAVAVSLLVSTVSNTRYPRPWRSCALLASTVVCRRRFSRLLPCSTKPPSRQNLGSRRRSR
jgi:hypothetical protein